MKISMVALCLVICFEAKSFSIPDIDTLYDALRTPAGREEARKDRAQKEINEVSLKYFGLTDKEQIELAAKYVEALDTDWLCHRAINELIPVFKTSKDVPVTKPLVNALMIDKRFEKIVKRASVGEVESTRNSANILIGFIRDLSVAPPRPVDSK